MLGVSALLILGGAAGLTLGTLFGLKRGGSLSLLLVPITTIVYISRWQANNPDLLRSTSGLDYLFGPLPPTSAALLTYGAVCLVKDHLANRDL